MGHRSFQIDNSGPSTNLTVLHDVLQKTGSLAVTLNKKDIGTGVQSVDIFYQEQQSGLNVFAAAEDFKPLLQDVTEDTAVLPLKSGRSYKLATASVDHVGNVQEIDFKRAVFVDFPEIKGSCLHLNNCSNHGNCSIFNLCVCELGFYGVECSQDKPSLEPPLLEVSTSGGSEDTPVALFLSATAVGDNVTNTASLTITIYGVAEGFSFSRGIRSDDQWVVRQEEFGNMFMNPSRDFSGNVTFKISAKITDSSRVSLRNSSLTLEIKAKADLPLLTTKNECANFSGIIPLSINSSLSDRDGSERFSIWLSGLPNGYRLIPPGRQENGVHYLNPESLAALEVRYEDKFHPFSLKVTAQSVELSNGDTAKRVKVINVTMCFPEFTCLEVKNCSGRGVCIGENKCKCNQDYTGHDCSKESVVNNGGKTDSNIGPIVGGAIGGLIFLVIVALLVVCLVKSRRKTATEGNIMLDDRTTALKYTNPIFEQDEA